MAPAICASRTVRDEDLTRCSHLRLVVRHLGLEWWDSVRRTLEPYADHHHVRRDLRDVAWIGMMVGSRPDLEEARIP